MFQCSRGALSMQRSAFLRIEKDEAGLASKQREGSKFLDKERERGGRGNMMNLSELRIYVYYD